MDVAARRLKRAIVMPDCARVDDDEQLMRKYGITREEYEAAGELLEPVYEAARQRAAARAAGLPVLLDAQARRIRRRWADHPEPSQDGSSPE